MWDEEASRISVVFTAEGFVEVVFENDTTQSAWTLPKDSMVHNQVGLCAGQVNTLDAAKQETDDRFSELPVLALQARISLVRRFKFEFLNLPRTGQRPRRLVRKKGQYVGYNKTGDQ